MKKFVLASKSYSLHLSDAHINWLQANGYPDADAYFCNDDRTNPALVACVEAVHNSMQPLVNHACFLIQEEKAAGIAMQADKEKLSAAIDEFVDCCVNAGVHQHKSLIILAMREPGDKKMPWNEAYYYFQRRFGRPIDAAQAAYEEYLRCYETPAIKAWQEAHSAVEQYCEENNLQCYFDDIRIDDGYVINTFDETRFTARAVGCEDEYDEYSSGWEKMELTPFLTHATVHSFVAEGDTDGLMEYLRSLQLNLNIED